MIETLPELNERYLKQGLPLLEHGIGINTGFCNVGNMGSEDVFSYTAIGEHMNLGARLEKLCKHYGIQLHVSEFTLKALSPKQLREFQIRPIDRIKMAGKNQFLDTFEILDRNHVLYGEEKLLREFEKAYYFYVEKKFKEALAILEPLREKYPEDRPIEILTNNCRYEG